MALLGSDALDVGSEPLQAMYLPVCTFEGLRTFVGNTLGCNLRRGDTVRLKPKP